MTSCIRGIILCAACIMLIAGCDPITLEGNIEKRAIAVSPDSQVIDPLRISPDIYTTLMKNEYVRVIENISKPGQKDFMHSHPEFALYVVAGEKRQISTPDGLIRTETLVPGAVAFGGPVDRHATENVGSTDLKIILVERKKHWMSGSEGADPVAVSPGIYRVIGEDEIFRVLEITLKPGEKDEPHGHPGGVLYAVNETTALLYIEGEGTKPFWVTAGQAVFQEPVQAQQMENTGSTALRLIMFELK